MKFEERLMIEQIEEYRARIIKDIPAEDIPNFSGLSFEEKKTLFKISYDLDPNSPTTLALSIDMTLNHTNEIKAIIKQQEQWRQKWN